MIEKSADVLIIGSGVAGIHTAMESASLGRKVVIVSKSDMGNSTKSPANTRYRQYFDLINKTGGNMGDSDLIGILCNFSESETDRIKKNTEMIETEFGYMPTNMSGKQIVQSIRSDMKELDIEEFSGFSLVVLMVNDNRCHGVVFRKNKDLIMFFAGATILATGGYSNLVGLFDNPITVDGYGICTAFRKGGVLLNPEFVMAHPFGVEFTKSIISGSPLEYPENVRSSKNHRIYLKGNNSINID